MKLEDFILKGQDSNQWVKPVPKKHTIAIATTIFVAITLSITLPTDNDEQLAQNSDYAQSLNYDTDANLQNAIVSYDTASVQLDNYDDTIAESELLDSDTDFDKNLQQLAKANNQQINSNNWYVESIERGDSLSSVFNDLNIPYATLQAITKNNDKQLVNLKPGQNLSFLLDGNNNLMSFVKQINDKEQIRYIRTSPDNLEFTKIKEPLNSHLSINLNNLNQAVAAVTQNDTSTNLPPQKTRGRLVLVTINKGQSFSSAAYDSGLTYSEIAQITQLFKGRIQFTRHIQPGDSLRVLFSEDKGAGSINAVEFKLARIGTLSIFRHLGDNKFYDENGNNAQTGTGFRRFPLNGKVRISSHFNPTRKHPVTGITRPHNGTDFAVNVGTPIYAPADGIVDKATYTRSTGYYIVIRHQGSYSTVYMHLSKLLVKPGQKVKLGSMIARSGNTGLSTGPHLHYELRINGRPVNAMKVNLPKVNEQKVPNAQKSRFVANVAKYKKDLYNQSLVAKK